MMTRCDESIYLFKLIFFSSLSLATEKKVADIKDNVIGIRSSVSMLEQSKNRTFDSPLIENMLTVTQLNLK
jgi:hypothetical protein